MHRRTMPAAALMPAASSPRAPATALILEGPGACARLLRTSIECGESNAARGKRRSVVCFAVKKLPGGIFEAAVPKPLRDKIALRPAFDSEWTGEHRSLPEFLSQAFELPQFPGYPRSLSQVCPNLQHPFSTYDAPSANPRAVAFSVPTGLVWYGWYKFCVEEELLAFEEHRSSGAGQGYGGYGTLGPFVFGLALGPLAASLGLPGGELWAAAGVIWIYYTQYLLYRRVNKLFESDGEPPPLQVWWLVVPGLNLVVGLRQVYFLADFFARQRGLQLSDPLAEFFPFITKPTLGWKELLRRPSLWASPLGSVSDLALEWLRDKDEDKPASS